VPVYEYKALDSKGRKLSGMLDAESPRLARAKLRAEGLYPVEIQSVSSGTATLELEEPLAHGRRFSFPTILRRVKPHERAALTRQLATLVGAGIPLVGALDTVIGQVRNRSLRRALVEIREEVMAGSSLAEAMGKHGWLFSDLYVNMVHAGESSGALETVLHRLADLMERGVRLRNRIQAALFYPIAMMAIGIVVLVFLLTYVVPIVTRLFAEAKQRLPGPTLLLIGMSDFLVHWWWAILIGVVALLFLGKRLLATPMGRLWWDRTKLRLPLIGSLYEGIVTARFARTLGVLLQGGLPLTSALSIVQHVVNNSFLAKHVEKAIQDVNEGEDLTVSLERSKSFDPMVIQMMAAGERSGTIEEMLIRIAEAYEEEVETKVAALTSLLEPFLILVMGLMVGFIVLSILLPILQMSRLLG